MTGAYLAHHGIKGMRWGVRRYQNEDGTLTAAGRERYLVGQARERLRAEKKAYRQANRQYRREINYGLVAYDPRIYVKGSVANKRYNRAVRENIKANLKYKAAKNEFKWTKEDLQNERISKRLDEKPNSKYLKKYQQQYVEKGMSPSEAKIAAYKKERAIKIAQIAGATALTAAVAYAAYRHYDSSVDRFLDSGVELKRVSSSKDLSVHDGFYAVLSKNRLDVTKYAGNFANELGGGYQKTIKVGSEGIRLASEKSGASALKNILSSREDVENLSYELQRAKAAFAMMGRQGNVAACEKAIRSLNRGKINRDVYKGLVSAAGVFGADTSSSLGEYRQKLFDQLRSNGYGAIQDVNDKYFSGYHAKMPVIVIDAGKAAVESVRYISDAERTRNAAIGTTDMVLAKLAPVALRDVGIYAGVKAAHKYRTKSQEAKKVEEYRKKHPGTTKSYTEIVRTLYKYR